jgi:hypothetical protein
MNEITQRLLESEILILRNDKERFQQHNSELVLKRQAAEAELVGAVEAYKKSLITRVHSLQLDEPFPQQRSFNGGWNAALRQVLELFK